MSDAPPAPDASRRTAVAVVLMALATVSALVIVDSFGWLATVRDLLDRGLGGVLGETFPRPLPPWVAWVAAGLVSVLLPLLMVQAACLWRRLVLWLTCLVVMAAWAPVLALSAYRPDVVLPCLAVVVAGLLAVVFAGWPRRVGDDAASDEAS